LQPLIPLILTGPIIRRTESNSVHVFIVTSKPTQFIMKFWFQGVELGIDAVVNQCIQLGKSCFANLVKVSPESPFPVDTIIEYELLLKQGGNKESITKLQPDLLYSDQQRLSFIIPKQLQRVLHGSCRKPHYPARDGLATADKKVAATVNNVKERPQLLMMTGDQVYIDDVAGPMVKAIEQVVQLLGLYDESFSDAPFSTGDESQKLADRYYQRENWLPYTESKGWFSNKQVAIFSSVYCHNHLVALREVIALYLLSWSSSLWAIVKIDDSNILTQFKQKFATEKQAVDDFIETLPQAQRLMAHTASYMIFDDHDITDDWNLTAAWETAAYGHSFAKRIIGNALWGYWLFQGWGNAPHKFDQAWVESFQRYGESPTDEIHDKLVNDLLSYEDWDYVVNVEPKMVVLDTRTNRWWSENNANKPSGLLDWEGLNELQQELKGEDKVLLISPAPIFGVKFIEAVQRIITHLGKPLMVDAENWMAHPGSAHSILNIFKSRKTPEHFIILSGDVHYSFVYDVELRFRQNSPHIWQITSSGIKNTFPNGLLVWLDRMNRWLYSRHSPLNWFTKRRRMKVSQRKNSTRGSGKLLNCSGIGYLEIDPDGIAKHISVLTSDGKEITFNPQD